MHVLGMWIWPLLCVWCSLSVGGRAALTTTVSRTTGSVQADEIKYVSLRVPSTTSSLRITVFLDRVKTTKGEAPPRPFVVVKKNGLPTTVSFDDKFALPSAPYALDIFDDAPEGGVVYLGIWGGETLNSLYWFAGAPQEIFYSVEVEIRACGARTSCDPNVPLLGLHLGGALSTALLSRVASTELALVLPPGLEQADVRIYDLAESFRGMSSLCTSETLLEAELFVSQPGDVDAAYASVVPCTTQDFALSLPFPRPGIWTLRLRLSSAAKNGSSGAEATRSLQAHTILLSDAHTLADRAKAGGTPSASTPAPVIAASIRLNASFSACPGGTTAASTQHQRHWACRVAVIPLVSDRDQRSPPSTVLLLGQDTLLEAAALAEVVFTADLGVQATALPGGALVIQLRMRLGGLGGDGASRAAVYARLRALDVQISLRCGAMAGPQNGLGAMRLSGSAATMVEVEDARSALDKGPPRPTTDQGGESQGGSGVLSTRLGQMLGLFQPPPPPPPPLSQQYHQRRQMTQDDDDDAGATAAYPGLLLVWTIDKPVLPGLYDGPLFIRVTASGDGSEALVMSVTVVAQACSEEGCSGHGQCVEYSGLVPFSGCACTYPYAGAHCESLVLPWAEYRLRAAILIGSNLAMVFAVVLCASCNMKVVGMVLVLSSASSMAYHACDLGIFCFAQSFRALQTLDISFSTLSVATLILHYSPGNAETHATLMVLVLGLLLSPIATNPTATQNIVGAVVLACVLSALVWLYALRGALSSACRGRTTRASLLELVSTKSSRRHSQRFRPVGADEAEEDGADAEREERGEDGEGEGGDLDELLHNAPGGDEGEWRATPVSNERAPVSTGPSSCVALWGLAWSLSLSLLGAALAAGGIASFALQTRLNYHVNHALWHFFVMLSAYPLIRGRGAVMHAVCAFSGINLLGPAAKKRPGY